MADHADTLLNMSSVTRRGWSYRPNRSVLLTIRVTPAERDALRPAAAEANMSVASFIRAAIAVCARDGYCQRAADSKSESSSRRSCPASCPATVRHAARLRRDTVSRRTAGSGSSQALSSAPMVLDPDPPEFADQLERSDSLPRERVPVRPPHHSRDGGSLVRGAQCTPVPRWTRRDSSHAWRDSSSGTHNRVLK